MKLHKRIFWRLLLGTTWATPIMATVACDSVNGKLEYEIIGFNADGTDYIINVTVDKQFIAKIIEKNRSNLRVLDEKIKARVLAKIRGILPQSYEDGEFKNFAPALKTISKTQFQVLVPIKKVISNLPQYSKVKAAFASKYKKNQVITDTKEKFEDEIFMPDLQSLNAGLQPFLTEKYDNIAVGQGLAKKDYVNFNYMGVMPYMAGKLTNDKLQSVLGVTTYASVDDLLTKKFQQKRDQEHIKETTTLPNTFEITNLRGKNMDVFFYITNIQEEDPDGTPGAPSGEKQYKLKDKTRGFDSTKNDKADVYFSLFLKKELAAPKSESVQVTIEDKTKIEKTKVESIFSGLKVGTQFSRVVEVDATKPDYDFTPDNSAGKVEGAWQDMIAAKLFTKEARTDAAGDTVKNDADEALYIAKAVATYKAIMTFDITKVETKGAGGKWVVKANTSIINKGDRVTYTNYKIEYLGLPFDRGAAMNHHAYNGKSGFIGTFDQQMEGMDRTSQKIITPIFPPTYETQSLKGKLVKFIIKINDIKRRKAIDAELLAVLKLKNLDGQHIETTNDASDYIESLFKVQLFEELVNDHFAKANAQVPHALVRSIYSQIYIDLAGKTRKPPNPKTVLSQAQSRAKLSAIIDEFFRVNSIAGNNFEAKRNKVLDEIYTQIPD